MSAGAAFSVARSAGRIPTERPFGKDMANNAFLRAYIESSEDGQLYLFASPPGVAKGYEEILPAITDRVVQAHYLSATDVERLREPGCLMHLDPHLAVDMWMRRTYDQRAFSMVGLIHTMAGPYNLDPHFALMTAPLQEWDALICTSVAVRRTVEIVQERWFDYLADRFGATRRDTLQLPILPLGVECERFVRTEARVAKGKALRRKLGIADDAMAVLYFGRLSFFEKAHPVPMFVSLEQAARRSGKALHVILGGWFPVEEHRAQYLEAARLFCPSVPVSVLDGREAETREAIWHAADAFTSLVDNIQETFGLAPIEAMAAGLPVVVSDWDGYRDTVRDGVDGFRIPTVLPVGGAGSALPLAHGVMAESYQRYVGATALLTTVDIARAAEAFATLAREPETRRRMGAAAAARAASVFDWPVVIHEYRRLWASLGEIRAKAAERSPRRDRQSGDPRVEDPFRYYAHFASRQLAVDTVVALSEGTDAVPLERIRASAINNMADRHIAGPPELGAAIDRLATEGPQPIRRLMEAVPVARRNHLYRGLAYLLKFGTIRIVG